MAKNGYDDIESREKGLSKGLTTGQLSMIAIGGSIGTGLFLGSGFAIQTAGPSVIISYLIGALVALLLMGCLAEMTVVHPTSGSFGSFAEHYIGPWAGYVVRYMYWFSIVGAVGTEVTAVAVYMKYWFPTSPAWIWVLLFSALLFGVNATSVNLFGKVEYWFSMIKIVAITAFIIIGAYIVFGNSGDGEASLQNYVNDGGFFPNGLSGTWLAVVVALFSYLSIEMIAVAAGEAQDPQKAVPKALRSTVYRLVLFYVLTIFLMVAIVPWSLAGIEESPFVKVFDYINIPFAGGVINFVVLIAALSAMNSQLYATTRMMFSLARAKQAPKKFGELNKRGVPIFALMLSALGIAAAAILNAISPDDAYIIMMGVATFAALFTWMMIFITHLFFRKQQEDVSKLKVKMWGYPYLTILGAGILLAVLITTPFVDGFESALFVGVPWLIFVFISYFVQRRRTNGN